MPRTNTVEIGTVSVEQHERLKEYVLALEHTRADLMSSNEELYEKVKALTRGSEDLQNIIDGLRGSVQLKA